MSNLHLPLTAPSNEFTAAISLANTVGALEIGVLIAIFLFGVLTVQVYVYFDGYPGDPWGFIFMVALTWLLDLGHTIAICHLLYTLTVTQYGKPELLTVPPRSLDVAILLSGFIGPLEQGWFTYRLYKFTKTLPLPLVCAILSLLRAGGSIALFAISLERPTIQEYGARWNWLIESVVIVGALVDTVLAVALCYYLSFWRKGGFQRMSKLVHQLMTWTIETGAITTAGALALLLTFLRMKDNFIYLAFFVMMAKLFSNSLLFSLNARNRFGRICVEGMYTTPSMTLLRSPGMSPQFELSPLSPLSPLAREPSKRRPPRIRTDLAGVVPTGNRQSTISFVGSVTSAQSPMSFLQV